MKLTSKIATVLVSAALLTSLTVTAPPPAKAQDCFMSLNMWHPVLNSNGNPLFKAQMKVITPGCYPTWIRVIVCAAYWNGSSRTQIGTCVDSGNVYNVTQVTRNKTVQGCTHNRAYVTKARGLFQADNVVYSIPEPLGSFAYMPPSGGDVLC